ncbi:SPOC domain-like protein [Trametes meyenii]|nr:SPOC domain-like protein [Trametes meyenii]
MNALSIQLTVVGVDFDDKSHQYEDKSDVKRANEEFYQALEAKLEFGAVGNCDHVLLEISRPDIREVKSTMTGNVLRIGDTDGRPNEAVEIMIKTSKATALARPKGFKKFARRKRTTEEEEEAAERMAEDEPDDTTTFAQLHMRNEYYLEDDKVGISKADASISGSIDGDGDDAAEAQAERDKRLVKVEKEELVRGYKYGASFVPAPDGEFPKLSVRKGMDLCGFFPDKYYRRELAMGEVYYVWADPASPMQQVALSSIVQAMKKERVMGIARWVKTDKGEPRMGVVAAYEFEEIDCLLWVQMPFADDVRNFTFASLETLVNKKGEVVKEHPYLPTVKQLDSMADFVDAMDLTDAGEKDEDGNRQPWFDTRNSYNPAIHRTKQALFHAAIVQDLNTHPLPPPHEELTKFFEPPRRVLKRAHSAIEECKRAFNVREVPKKVTRIRKDEHVRARDEDDEMLLLDRQGSSRAGPSQSPTQSRVLARSQSQSQQQTTPSRTQKKPSGNDSDSSQTEPEEDEEDEEELLLEAKHRPERTAPLPTPARSLSPDTRIGRNREPGRIIGLTYPLDDFKKNIAQGDVVTKAVEDLGYVIKQALIRPFASRRHDEMLECMHELRKVSLEEDEIDAWNAFAYELKDVCLKSKPGNKEFWDNVRSVGRPLSLISQPEARKAGGKSAITESEAQKFVQD